MPSSATPTPPSGSAIATTDAISILLDPGASGFLYTFTCSVSYDGGATSTEAFTTSGGTGFENGFSGTPVTNTGSPQTFVINAPPWPAGPVRLSIYFFNGLSSLSLDFDYTAGGGGPVQHHTTPEITDHCALAKDRLASQFKGKPKLGAYICALSDGCQELEQACADVLAYRSLTTSYGAGFDRLGSTLGLARGGLADAVYQARLGVMATVIGSGGSGDELQAILTALDAGYQPSEITYAEPEPATVIMHCQVHPGQQADGVAYARLLHAAKPNAVRMILEFEEHGVTWFQFQELGGSTPPTGSGWTEHGGSAQGHWREAADGAV